MFFLVQYNLIAQEETKTLKVVGDSLIGKKVNGESVRQVIGNVVITQKNVRITCNKAIQYVNRNEVELTGKVIVVQDSVIIKSAKGYYFGNSEMTSSDTTIHLTNGKMELTANKGYYFLKQKIANFSGNVLLVNGKTKVNSDSLRYYENEEKAIALGNVKVIDSSSVVFADSLIHLLNDKNSFAFGHVKLTNKEKTLFLFGKKLEDFAKSKIIKIYGEPALVQLDSVSENEIDTLMIKSVYMQAHNDSSQILIAEDSVKILRGEFASLNNHTIYHRKEGIINIFKTGDEDAQPILWYENSQVTGDSIKIKLTDKKIKSIEINNNALIVSTLPDYEYRYNQISGDSLKLFFRNGKLNETLVNGNVLSLYYLFEDNEPNGLLKSSGEKAKIYFDSNKVANVRLYGSPLSEYHPEQLVKGREKNFTLPNFILYKDRPQKDLFNKYLINLN